MFRIHQSATAILRLLLAVQLSRLHHTPRTGARLHSLPLPITVPHSELLGESLAATYDVERELTGGGMSRVFLARDRQLGRQVVIKILPRELAAAVSLERFRREILLAAGLQHPHIVPVHAAGETNGLPYLIMPYVEGESLRARLKRGRPRVAEAVAILRDVARALAYAHTRGIVHRDIKPDNVLISAGSAAVADFGVAKAISSAWQSDAPVRGTLTMSGTSLGTPDYMAPEQVAADPSTDHRADIYAFGIMAYEMLTGETPFHGRSPRAMFAAHLTEPPLPLGERRPDLPARLCALVMRCLEKDPAHRPQSAEELAEALADPEVISGAFASLASTMAYYYSGVFDDTKVHYELTILGRSGQMPWGMLETRADAPFKTWNELVAYAKQNPGKLSAGGPATGGMMNLIVLETAKSAGINVVYVPFAGGGPSGSALLGGHIQYRVAQPTEVFPNVRAGKTRGLAVGFPTRIPEMPDVPTFRELGIQFDVPVFGFDLWGPPKLPAAIASQLTKALEAAVKDPEYVEAAKRLTYQPVFVGPEPLKEMMRQFEKDIGPKLVAAFPPEKK